MKTILVLKLVESYGSQELGYFLSEEAADAAVDILAEDKTRPNVFDLMGRWEELCLFEVPVNVTGQQFLNSFFGNPVKKWQRDYPKKLRAKRRAEEQERQGVAYQDRYSFREVY